MEEPMEVDSTDDPVETEDNNINEEILLEDEPVVEISKEGDKPSDQNSSVLNETAEEVLSEDEPQAPSYEPHSRADSTFSEDETPSKQTQNEDDDDPPAPEYEPIDETPEKRQANDETFSDDEPAPNYEPIEQTMDTPKKKQKSDEERIQEDEPSIEQTNDGEPSEEPINNEPISKEPANDDEPSSKEPANDDEPSSIEPANEDEPSSKEPTNEEGSKKADDASSKKATTNEFSDDEDGGTKVADGTFTDDEEISAGADKATSEALQSIVDRLDDSQPGIECRETLGDDSATQSGADEPMEVDAARKKSAGAGDDDVVEVKVETAEDRAISIVDVVVKEENGDVSSSLLSRRPRRKRMGKSTFRSEYQYTLKKKPSRSYALSLRDLSPQTNLSPKVVLQKLDLNNLPLTKRRKPRPKSRQVAPKNTPQEDTEPTKKRSASVGLILEGPRDKPILPKRSSSAGRMSDEKESAPGKKLGRPRKTYKKSIGRRRKTHVSTPKTQRPRSASPEDSEPRKRSASVGLILEGPRDKPELPKRSRSAERMSDERESTPRKKLGRPRKNVRGRLQKKDPASERVTTRTRGRPRKREPSIESQEDSVAPRKRTKFSQVRGRPRQTKGKPRRREPSSDSEEDSEPPRKRSASVGLILEGPRGKPELPRRCRSVEKMSDERETSKRKSRGRPRRTSKKLVVRGKPRQTRGRPRVREPSSDSEEESEPPRKRSASVGLILDGPREKTELPKRSSSVAKMSDEKESTPPKSRGRPRKIGTSKKSSLVRGRPRGRPKKREPSSDTEEDSEPPRKRSASVGLIIEGPRDKPELPKRCKSVEKMSDEKKISTPKSRGRPRKAEVSKSLRNRPRRTRGPITPKTRLRPRKSESSPEGRVRPQKRAASVEPVLEETPVRPKLPKRSRSAERLSGSMKTLSVRLNRIRNLNSESGTPRGRGRHRKSELTFKSSVEKKRKSAFSVNWTVKKTPRMEEIKQGKSIRFSRNLESSQARGRPRKSLVVDSTPKRGRGRPRKVDSSPPRKMGRPRKVDSTPPRQRGRPRKELASDSDSDSPPPKKRVITGRRGKELASDSDESPPPKKRVIYGRRGKELASDTAESPPKKGAISGRIRKASVTSNAEERLPPKKRAISGVFRKADVDLTSDVEESPSPRKRAVPGRHRKDDVLSPEVCVSLDKSPLKFSKFNKGGYSIFESRTRGGFDDVQIVDVDLSGAGTTFVDLDDLAKSRVAQRGTKFVYPSGMERPSPRSRKQKFYEALRELSPPADCVDDDPDYDQSRDDFRPPPKKPKRPSQPAKGKIVVRSFARLSGKLPINYPGRKKPKKPDDFFRVLHGVPPCYVSVHNIEDISHWRPKRLSGHLANCSRCARLANKPRAGTLQSKTSESAASKHSTPAEPANVAILEEALSKGRTVMEIQHTPGENPVTVKFEQNGKFSKYQMNYRAYSLMICRMNKRLDSDTPLPVAPKGTVYVTLPAPFQWKNYLPLSATRTGVNLDNGSPEKKNIQTITLNDGVVSSSRGRSKRTPILLKTNAPHSVVENLIRNVTIKSGNSDGAKPVSLEKVTELLKAAEQKNKQGERPTISLQQLEAVVSVKSARPRRRTVPKKMYRPPPAAPAVPDLVIQRAGSNEKIKLDVLTDAISKNNKLNALACCRDCCQIYRTGQPHDCPKKAAPLRKKPIPPVNKTPCKSKVSGNVSHCDQCDIYFPINYEHKCKAGGANNKTCTSCKQSYDPRKGHLCKLPTNDPLTKAKIPKYSACTSCFGIYKEGDNHVCLNGTEVPGKKTKHDCSLCNQTFLNETALKKHLCPKKDTTKACPGCKKIITPKMQHDCVKCSTCGEFVMEKNMSEHVCAKACKDCKKPVVPGKLHKCLLHCNNCDIEMSPKNWEKHKCLILCKGCLKYYNEGVFLSHACSTKRGKCETCKTVLQGADYDTHTCKSVLRCQKCSFLTTNQVLYDRHACVAPAKEVFKCDGCPKMFSKSDFLEKHKATLCPNLKNVPRPGNAATPAAAPAVVQQVAAPQENGPKEVVPSFSLPCLTDSFTCSKCKAEFINEEDLRVHDVLEH